MKHLKHGELPFINLAIIQHLGYACFNTVNADVKMSTNFMTFVSFFWYFLVSAVAMPLTLTAAKETVPRGILTRRPMNILSMTTLDIPEATLRPLGQVFSNVSLSKVLEYLLCFGRHLDGRIVEPKVQLGELDTSCNLLFS